MHLALLIVAALGGPPPTFELSAERLVHDGKAGRAYAEGNAELVTEGSALHAERITWDEASQSATAIGNVVLRLTSSELLVVVADVLTVRFERDEVREVFVNDGKVLSKKGVTPEALRALTSPEAAVAAGETTMLLKGNHLVREGGLWRVDRLELVPCECNFEDPSWSIRASDAVVDPVEQRASLWSPVVRVHGVPVLWLPWISLPLSNRQTGLLIPKPGFTALSGFSLEQPVFFTLGRSADLTLVPGFFGGPQGTPAPPFGIQGPRLLTEFRYAPAEGDSGRVTLGLLWDLRSKRSPANPLLVREGARGLRAEGSWQHAQALGSGWHTRVDAAFLSDGYYLRDQVADVLAREAGYLRSTAAVFHRGPGHWVGVDVALRQDLSYGYPLLGRSGAERADPARLEPLRGPSPLHRAPAITLAIPERPLLGPVNFALVADWVRLGPVRGQSGDEGALANEGRSEGLSVECLRQRLYWLGPPTAACWPPPDRACQVDSDCAAGEACGAAGFCGVPTGDPWQGDGVWQPGERESRQRLGVLPRLTASLPLAVATLSPYAAWRQGVWLGERTGTVTHRGYPVLGARLDSELARSFGQVRHAIAPAVEVRGIPLVLGSAPAPYDEVDTALVGTAAVAQALVELRQRVTRDGADLVRLDLAQGVQLSGAAPALGESSATVAGALGWFTASASGRVDAPQARLTRLSATAALSDGQGHGGYLTYENLINDGTDRSRRPIDLLFAPPAVSAYPGRAQSLSFGAYWRLWGVGLRYDALLLDPTGLNFTLAQHTAGVSYAPACDCFRLEVTATQRGPDYYRVPDFGATLTVSRFGSFGVAR